jgi:hypothetical protein
MSFLISERGQWLRFRRHSARDLTRGSTTANAGLVNLSRRIDMPHSSVKQGNLVCGSLGSQHKCAEEREIDRNAPKTSALSIVCKSDTENARLFHPADIGMRQALLDAKSANNAAVRSGAALSQRRSSQTFKVASIFIKTCEPTGLTMW